MTSVLAEKMVREKDAGGMPYEFKFGEADNSINHHHHHSYSSHGRNGSSRGTHSSREDSHKRTALNYYQPTGFNSKKVNYNNVNSSGYGQRSLGYGQQSDRFSFKGPPSSHARQPPSSSGRSWEISWVISCCEVLMVFEEVLGSARLDLV